jgi:diguanylate cyclase (GGDEF)-like protein
MRSLFNLTFQKQLSAAVAIAMAWVVTLSLLGWWASSEIDGQANQRQNKRAEFGLTELMERLPKEQDSSAIWDEAVSAVRANDGDWMAENLVEWLGEFYGHERVYVLDPNNAPLRAAVEGESADPTVFWKEAEGILPLVDKLRAAMAAASEGEVSSTDAVSGIGEAGFVRFSSGETGLVSVRPILSETEEVTLRPGEEYLHVSIEMLNAALLSQISSKYGLEHLAVAAEPPAGASAIPLIGVNGEPVAWLTWELDRPAARLLERTAPLLLVAACFGVVCVTLLLMRLRRTTTDLQQSKAEAIHLAFHDQLTGLPNRALFEDRLERAITASRRGTTSTVLHYLDLDNFKHVNDTLGHPSGDELVRQAATRLKENVREVDTVARLGGDEFAIVQVDSNGEADAAILGEKVLAAFEEPFMLHGEEVRITASIGAAVHRKGDMSPAGLMRQADVALYEAKAAGRARHRIYAGEMDDVLKRRRQLERDLRKAIDTGDGLYLAYQPIYAAADRSMVGAEALARWDHPHEGNIPPDFFVKLAEERGLIERLGNFVLRQACTFAVEHDLPWIAVNLSPLQFKDSHLADRVAAIVDTMGLAPDRLQIEVTEGVLLQDSPAVRETIRQLRLKGVSVALDDFGTGYSSISYLRTYGVDKLKIDRSFVSQLGEDHEVDSIVQAIIDLARAMRMTVTAEGVETQEQLRILRNMGCTELQGYLLSKPVSAEQFIEKAGSRLSA